MTSLRALGGVASIVLLAVVQGCSCASDTDTLPGVDSGPAEDTGGGGDGGGDVDGGVDDAGADAGCVATPEICNGVDDDCNGMIDDGFAAMETCGNGVDDDCNMMIDDTCVCTDGATQPCWSGDPALRGIGACVEGMQTCVAGRWDVCTGEGASTPETCNGMDDDCNGMDDDGFGSTTCGVGACTATVMDCVGGVPQTCVPGTPAAETCNSADDDCNGMVDDLGSTTCGMGACMTTVMNCVGGVAQMCVPGTPSAETCNGADDDCDGMVDDGLGSTTCGLGVCQATVMDCVGGIPQMCVPGMAGAETCNGLDDDCDGTVDDGAGSMACYTGPMGTRGVGACRDGNVYCSGGAMSMCTGDVTPSAEACDAIDNDCDGMTDEGLGMFTCGVGACQRSVAACTMGVANTCRPGAPAAEVCGNAIDDNCNGIVDDGCGCVHVSPRGSDMTGLGTSASPLRTIAAGIRLAAMGSGMFPPIVCVGSTTTCGTMPATTDYPEAVVMANGISVYGSYLDGGPASTSWSRRTSCGTRILAQDSRGVYFGHSITSPTAIDGFTINARNDTTNAAVTVEGSTGAIINNNAINGGAGTTSRGVNVTDGSGVAATPRITANAITGGSGSALSIGVRSFRSAPVITGHCSSRDAAGRCQSYGCWMSTLFIRGRAAGVAGGSEVYGVRLEDSPNTLLADNAICGSGSTTAGAGVRLSGDAAGVVIRASNIEAGGLTRSLAGFWATGCNDAAPWLVDNFLVSASCGLLGCRADGVRAIGSCHPVIDSNVLIVGGEESSNNDANGVWCALDAATGTSSRCTVIGNTQIRGSWAGMPPSAVGVRCDAGACALIARNSLITGWAGQSTAGIILGNSDTVVEDNGIDAGCATMNGMGILATNSFARIQNNIIAGSSQAACARLMRMATPTRAGPSWGVRIVNGGNELDLHSNTIFGTGGGTAPCTSRGVSVELSSSGAPPGPRGIIRNNIIHAGTCSTRYAFDEGAAAADPRILENNDLWGLPGAPTALYHDEGTTDLTTITSVNSLADIASANNISADPMLNTTFHIAGTSACVDAGTATGAPATDFEGEARPNGGGFDIGADEYY